MSGYQATLTKAISLVHLYDRAGLALALRLPQDEGRRTFWDALFFDGDCPALAVEPDPDGGYRVRPADPDWEAPWAVPKAVWVAPEEVIGEE